MRRPGRTRAGPEVVVRAGQNLDALERHLHNLLLVGEVARGLPRVFVARKYLHSNINNFRTIFLFVGNTRSISRNTYFSQSVK